MERKDISFNDLEEVFSSERLKKYLYYALGNKKEAIKLYAYNISVSSCFQLPLHVIEVVLRNIISNALSNKYGEDWIMNCEMFYGDFHKNQVNEKIEKIKKEKRCNDCDISYGQIIAEQSFSFWTSMFGRKNEVIWQKCLYNIVIESKRSNTSRKSFSEPLSDIRYIRNRVAHYEPIIHKNYMEYYEKILNLLSLISETAMFFCEKYETFTKLKNEQFFYIFS